MDIELTNAKVPTNYVLVKLDPDFDTFHNTETGNDTGIHIAPWGINQATHLGVTGEVVKVPERLIYHGALLTNLKRDKDRSPGAQQHIANLRQESMAYDVPMELSIGMKVYFEYTTRLNSFKEGRAFENSDGKYILIAYDMLVMAFRPTTDFADVKITDVYPLNGFMLIKPLEYATEKGSAGIKGVKTEADIFLPVQEDAKYVKQRNLWYGNILSTGCYVRGYVDFPDAGSDNIDPELCKVGQKIVYDGRQQKRLEQPAHRVIFKKHELYRIHRKNVFGIVG